MIVRCNGFLLTHVPDYIKRSLNDNHYRLCKYFNLDIDKIDAEKMLEDRNNLPKDVDETLKKQIIRFYKRVLNIEWNEQVSPTYDLIYALLTAGFVLDEQHDYLNETEADCDIWVIMAELNGELYGGTFAFHNKKYADCLIIQGITKFLVPTIIIANNKEEPNKVLLPHLNSLIMPLIENLARALKCKSIQVSPMGKQGKILRTYYEYKTKESERIVPSIFIRESYEETLEKIL